MTVSKHLAALPAPGLYARAWRRLINAPAGKFVDLGFPRGMVRADVALADFRRALDLRVNARGGIERTGRKMTERYQTDLMRDARLLDDHFTYRVRVHRFALPEMNKRFAHLLAIPDD